MPPAVRLKPDTTYLNSRTDFGPAFCVTVLKRRRVEMLRVPLDGEEQLVKLPADASFRPAVVQILERPLETAQRPLERHLGILVHVLSICVTTKFHA